MPKNSPNQTKTAYGVRFAADFPVDEMDAIHDFDLVLEFENVPAPLFPESVSFISEDDVSTRITWGGYGFEEASTTMIIRLQELYFDELPCTLLGAYVVAYASKCFWVDAVTPSDLDFRFRIPDGKIQPVAARFEAGPFAIDIAKMMETVCFIN